MAREFTPEYPPEFRPEAVRLLRSGPMPEELRGELRVSGQTLRNWHKQLDPTKAGARTV